MKKLITLLFVFFLYSQNIESRDLSSKMQIGMILRELNDSERYYDYLERLSGCYVDSVIVDSNADRIGLRKGDIITRINGVVVDSLSEIAAMISKMKKGDFINIEILRHFVPRVLEYEFANLQREEDTLCSDK